MAAYSMTCSCGEAMTVEAETRDDAVAMLKAGMTEETIAEHMKAFHGPDEESPTVDMVHGAIDQMVVAV